MNRSSNKRHCRYIQTGLQGCFVRAAGDIYVTVKFCKLPKDVLIKDAGTSMKVFAKSK